MQSTKDLLKRVQRIQITTNRLVEDLLQGAYRSTFKGNGMEFEEVRAYQTGDDIRAIDWNVTARLNYPYVKTFREERELTVMLMIDMSASSRFGTTAPRKKDLIAEVAAVLTFSAIKNNDKVGLILFTDRVEKYIPPKKGTRHALRVIRELLAFTPKGAGTDIASALSFLGRVQRRTTVSFLFSDFITHTPYDHEVKIVSKSHDFIAVAVNDPLEQQIPSVGLVTIKDLELQEEKVVDFSDPRVRQAYHHRAIERQQHVKTLMKKVNAGYLELQSDQPYEAAIRKYFAMRK